MVCGVFVEDSVQRASRLVISPLSSVHVLGREVVTMTESRWTFGVSTAQTMSRFVLLAMLALLHQGLCASCPGDCADINYYECMDGFEKGLCPGGVSGCVRCLAVPASRYLTR